MTTPNKHANGFIRRNEQILHCNESGHVFKTQVFSSKNKARAYNRTVLGGRALKAEKLVSIPRQTGDWEYEDWSGWSLIA